MISLHDILTQSANDKVDGEAELIVCINKKK